MVFERMFDKFQRYESKDGNTGEFKMKECFDSKELKQFEQLLLEIGDDDLASVIKETLKVIERETQEKRLKDEKNKKKGWFSWGSSKKQDENQIDQQDIEKLNEYLEETFGQGEDDDIDDLAYRKILKLDFKLEGGSFYLSDVTPKGMEEGVCFFYQGLES
mmetsp:Transcript_16701/g.14582  ORF Transcript_16701/g.14582 Transcript_16701/m.14582 type:complete len:161 (-) Transcript_16701:450-932(-)